MSPWVLDDGPFGELALQFNPAWAWPSGLLHLVREVANAAAQDRSGRRKGLLQMEGAGGVVLEVHDIIVGSQASEMLFNHLRRNATDADKDLGEHASIAFCAAEATDATFVAGDKLATFLALAELGPGRVASPFDLWAYLRDQGLISAEEFGRLCDRTVKLGGLPGVPRRFADPLQHGAA